MLYKRGEERFHDPLIETLQHLSNTGAYKIAASKYAVLMQRELEEARKEAELDELTGLAKRKIMARTIDSAVAEGKQFGVLMMDLQNLNLLNDSYAHRTGDRGKVAFANLLKRMQQEHNLNAFLTGGDEFAAVVHDVSAEKLREIADEIKRRFTAEIHSDDEFSSTGFNVDVGLVHSTGGKSASELLSDADADLKNEKLLGLDDWGIRMVDEHLRRPNGLPRAVVDIIYHKLGKGKTMYLIRATAARMDATDNEAHRIKLSTLHSELVK